MADSVDENIADYSGNRPHPDRQTLSQFEPTVEVKIERCNEDGSSIQCDSENTDFPSSHQQPQEITTRAAKVRKIHRSTPSKKSNFICRCGFVCDDDAHLKKHTKENKCSVLEHTKRTSNDGKRKKESLVKCPLCPIVCLDKRRVGYHLKLYHEAFKLCPTCGLELRDLRDFYHHMNIFHDVQNSTLCVYCGGHFASNEERNEHIVEVHSHECGCERCGSKLICSCTDFTENAETPNESEMEYNSGSKNDDLIDADDIKKEAVSPVPGTSYGSFIPETIITEPDSDNDTSESVGDFKYSFEMSSEHANDYDFKLPLVPQKLDDLSQQVKCAIVTKMHKGKSVREICKMYDLTTEVVHEIWQLRDTFVVPTKMGMKPSKHMNKVLDDKVLDWFQKQKDEGVQVSGKMLINQAEEYAKECGFVIFNGNIKWLDRFKSRHNISLRPNQPRKSAPRTPNDAKWKEQFLTDVWPKVSDGYDFDEIYAADEVGLFYNASKGRIRKHTGRKYIHGFNKDRFSIFLCINITGYDRKRIVVCGSEDPLAHSTRDTSTLPVQYTRQSLSHFTTEMFEDYVRKWNEELKKTDQKALLILDRVSIHSKLPLSHLKLVFVPWKASTVLMPIKHGIFFKFREEFRKLLLQDKSMMVQRGIDRNLTCLEGLEMVRKAWRRVPQSTIIESFRLTGYKVPSEKHRMEPKPKKTLPNEADRLCKLLRDYDIEEYFTNLTNLDMYLTVDDDLLTAQGTNGSVFGGNHKVTVTAQESATEKGVLLPVGEYKPADGTSEAILLRNRAFADLNRIRKYLYQKVTVDNTFRKLLNVEQVLYQTQPKHG